MIGDRIKVRVDADLQDLIPNFLKRRQSELVELRAALDDGNFAMISATAHKLKGTGTSYGFEPISDVGEAMQFAADAQDVTEVSRQLDRLADYLEHIDIEYE